MIGHHEAWWLLLQCFFFLKCIGIQHSHRSKHSQDQVAMQPENYCNLFIFNNFRPMGHFAG